MWAGCAVGVALRFLLYAVGAEELLEEHLELNTPIVSHARLKECLFLLDEGISPYPGDTCHHTPLVLWLLLPLHRHAPAAARFALLVAVDLATALLLRTIAAQYAAARARAGPLWAEAQRRSLRLTGSDASSEKEKEESDASPPLRDGELLSPTFVGLLYFLNPITVASCGAQSLQSLHHVALAAAVALAGAGRGGASAAALAGALYVCPLTPAVLVIPCAWLSYCQSRPDGESNEYERSKEKATFDAKFLFYLARFLLALLALLGCLVGASFASMGGESHFVHACFLSVLRVRDLTPNVGVFWYLFCEVFNRFRAIFQFFCHAHILFYMGPLQLRIGRHRPLGPFQQAVAALALITLFKPYPTASDHAFLFSALLVVGEALRESEKHFVFLMGGQLFGLCMFPTMVAVWLGRNAGNANFLYNMTLVIAIFGGYLLIEWLKAVIRLRKRHRIILFCRGVVDGALDAALGQAPAGDSLGASSDKRR